MRKSFLTATAILSLTLAPAVWAQQRGEGGGAPGAGAQSPGGAHGEMGGGKAGGDMRSPGGESGGPRGEAQQPGGGMRQGAGEDMRGGKAKGAERDQSPATKGAEPRRRRQSQGRGARP